MASFLNMKSIRAAHNAIRKSTNKISRETFMARTQINNRKIELKKLYEKTGMSKVEKRNALVRDMRIHGKDITKVSQAKLTGELREIEKNRLILEDARDFIGNPIRRLNSLTALDKAMAPQRAAVAQLLLHAGPAELETIALSARSTGDLPTLAACISKNNTIPVKDRRLKNADMMSGVVLPDQPEIDAVLQEAIVLPMYATSCERSLRNLGIESGTSRIERGLQDRQVELQTDGALAPFEFGHNVIDGMSEDKDTALDPLDDPRIYPDGFGRKENLDPESIKPENYETYGEYFASGGEELPVKTVAKYFPDCVDMPPEVGDSE